MIVLNGQPRSGTSMMMRVLSFGGIPIEYDDDSKRNKALYRNIHGFFETREPTHTKCFKCTTPLNKSKVDKMTKIIFIQRDLDQQIKSWESIRPDVNHASRCAHIRKLFEEGLEGYSYLKIKYEDMVTNPRKQCERIRDFVNDEFNFNVENAIKAVDRTLTVRR
jgi:hypothetical protein